MTARNPINFHIALTLTVTLIVMSLFLHIAVSAHQVIETHIVGAPERLGYHVNWEQRLFPGQPLRLIKDENMKPGYERVLVAVDNDVIGFLPEFSGGEQVREAWLKGQTVFAELIAVDPLDPARGLKTQVMIKG